MSTAEIIAAVALIVSAIAGIFAYIAPLRAARLAEELRQRSLQSDKETLVFNILMAERGNWGSPSMLSALNVAKMVFRKNQRILDKWFVVHKTVHTDVHHENYFDLLAEIGKHLGHDLRREDFENYFVNTTIWPAPGSEDTELGVLMGPEGGHGETEVYARVQA